MKPIVRSIIFVSCLTTSVLLSRCGGGSSLSVPPLTITPASLPNGTLGTVYSQTIQAGGGVAPFSWAVSGVLPHNLQLVPGAGNTATISGTPDTAAQGVAFTIKVTDSANQSATQSYTVSILAEADTLSFSPATGLSFSPQLIGTAGTTQAETVTNNGTSAVTINSIGLTGTNAADFSQTNECGSSLAAGANCSLTVTFTPSQLGPRSASITITDSTLGSPHSVSLSGVGLTSGSNATLSAGSLTFGNQAVGTTSPAQSLTLSNYGSMTLSIVSVAVAANFGENDTCSSSNLTSGASCTINVTFAPSATGGVSGTLSVTDNASGSPQTVSISGTGTTNQDTLTGYCWSDSNINNICTLVKDPAECPAGQPARSPNTVSLGCFFPHGSRLVDTSRHCHSANAHGYCAVMTGSSASVAAATGSLR
jgi:hypothetical protein